MKYNYEVYEDNAGGLHLAVLDGANCVYYLCDLERGFVLATLDDLKRGGDPIEDSWDAGQDDPAACYAYIRQAVEARNGGAWDFDA